MKKTFVLDTNVLLHDPKAIYRFEENDVILPIAIIEELDRFKKSLDETGRNARQVSRTLDQLRGRGSLTDGILLEGEGTLKVSLLKPLQIAQGRVDTLQQFFEGLLVERVDELGGRIWGAKVDWFRLGFPNWRETTRF